ncbi:jg10288 [Pararge aegeria aegeria]|uniref:Jg10288 protein n=1 Tax=Pararge aegeria aegeria TaxID=348720 RepID=A0A8S4S2I1_9NEOP|nr:jg10288 [Pararge aegeria aegeria]
MWLALQMTGGASESCTGDPATKAGRAEDRVLVGDTTLKLSQGRSCRPWTRLATTTVQWGKMEEAFTRRWVYMH